MIDLSGKAGTVTNVVEAKLEEINQFYTDPNVTNLELQDNIVEIVSTAKKTKKRDQIMVDIRTKKTKDATLFFIYNTCLAGNNMKVIK